MTICVRLARDDDQSFIDALGIQTAVETLSPLRAVADAVAEQAYKRLIAFCRGRSDTVTFVGEADGRRAGFLIMLTDVPDDVTQMPQAFVAYVAVLALERGRGIGRALVQAAEAESRRRKLPHISLMVSADNSAARSLYVSEHFMQERILMTRPLRDEASA